MNDDDELPTKYDVIVYGTGMTESIVAAACSRIGKKVLHFDSDDYYGGVWASFNLEALLKIAEDDHNAEDYNYIGLYNIVSQWYIKKAVAKPPVVKTPNEGNNQTDTNPSVTKTESDLPKSELPEDDVRDEIHYDHVKHKTLWTQDSVRKEYRRFNLDLVPKLLFARGELVDLLITSNISRYAEFRCVNRVLTWINDNLEPVPCSRADVFATKHVSVVEKRMLMKLLTSLMEYGEKESVDIPDIENKTFLEYLKSKKLTSNLIHYVLYAIAGGTESMSCSAGIKKCKMFLTSLGKYGNTPFLWSMYGCGELPQCFCRLCAVYGGVYCLKRELDGIEMIEDCPKSWRGIKLRSEGKSLKCEHLVISLNKVPLDFYYGKISDDGISRAIFITNKSIMESEKEPLTLLQFPPLEGKKYPVTIIELGPSTFSCPKGLYVLHMTCKETHNAEVDLIEYAKKLLELDDIDSVYSESSKNSNHKKPQVIWSMFFNMKDTSKQRVDIPSPNVFVCTGPDTELDFDNAVQQAKKIFSMISDEEFLPRAPDPDEIVFDGEDGNVGPIFEKDINKSSESDNNSNSNLEGEESTVTDLDTSGEKETKVVDSSNVNEKTNKNKIDEETNEDIIENASLKEARNDIDNTDVENGMNKMSVQEKIDHDIAKYDMDIID